MRGPTSTNERDPRAILIFIVALFVIQGIYAGLEILPEASSGRTLDLALGVAFVAYAVMITAVAYGVWRKAAWTWSLAVATTVVGLALAVVRVADGRPLSEHLLGMVIDAGLFIYLQRSSVKVLFGR